MNLINKRVYIAGHKGMVGSAVLRKLRREGFQNLILKTFEELDLRNQNDVNCFFEKERPEIVILAAAKVGGILANNTYRAEFIYDNLMISANVVHASYIFGVEKLIFLGSSCIYPKFAPQPLKEEYLLTGELESTNEPYAIAKIAGIKLCENYFRQYGCNFFSIMPTNLYGPYDNFDLLTSHVVPALIHKIHYAKVNNLEYFEIWGTGKPRREFLYVDDLADAIYNLMININAKDIYSKGISHINVGTGEDLTIIELVDLLKKIIGYHGKVVFDKSKPDGTPRKLLDVSRINELGWKPKTSLEEGLKLTYKWFLENCYK